LNIYVIVSILLVILAVICIGMQCLRDFFIAPLSISRGSKQQLKNMSALIRTHCANIYHSINTKLSENTKILIYVIIFLLISRFFMYTIAYIGYCCFGDLKTPGLFPTLEKIWTNCDAPRYLQVAQNSYVAAGEYNDMINIAFYPLFPLLVYLFHFICGSYFYAALLVSFVALTAACFYLYKLLRMDYASDVSQRVIKFFLIYPFSMFLSAVYTESTFMAFSLMCVYYMRKKNWLVCGCCGLLASFCRTQGILLVIPVAYEIALALWKERKWTFKYLYTLLIPIGYGAYLTINKIVTGNWFKFMEYQSFYWKHSFTMFYNSLGGVKIFV